MSAFGIGTFEFERTEFPGAVVGDVVYDIRDVLPGISQSVQLLEDWDANLDRIAAFVSNPAAKGRAWARDALRALPPLQPATALLAAGANYREHIIQMSVAHHLGVETASPARLRADAAKEIDERVRSGDPYVWVGMPSAMCGADDDIQLPEVGGDVDWEVELGVVIGARAHRVSATRALEHVAGYLIVNDITARTLVPRHDIAGVGTDWFRAKNQPTFFPTGPFLLPARFVPNPSDLRIQLRLNGALMQDASVADIAFDVPSLIAYASSLTVLEPGTILITGSPEGNGSHWGRFLDDGDVLEASITGLGTQRNLVRGPTGILPPWQVSRAGVRESS